MKSRIVILLIMTFLILIVISFLMLNSGAEKDSKITFEAEWVVGGISEGMDAGRSIWVDHEKKRLYNWFL